MYSKELMRYIIDPNDSSYKEKLMLDFGNFNNSYGKNLKKDIKNIKFSTSWAIKLYCKTLKLFYKTTITFKEKKISKKMFG